MFKSNHYKHLIAGLIIQLIGLAIGFVLTRDMLASSVTSTYSVLVAMCSVEYIQKSFGCKWDWIDILYGLSSSIVFSIVFLLYL